MSLTAQQSKQKSLVFTAGPIRNDTTERSPQIYILPEFEEGRNNKPEQELTPRPLARARCLGKHLLVNWIPGAQLARRSKLGLKLLQNQVCHFASTYRAFSSTS